MSHITKLIFSRADMTTVRKVPTFDEMMWPTLLALKRMGGSASNQELLTCVMKLMAIPEEVQNLPHGDGPKSEIEYRLLWTRTSARRSSVRECQKRQHCSVAGCVQS